MDAALSKLAALEARASATFDVSAKKPIITGSAVDVFGREGRPAGTWDGLVAQAAELDAAFRELRPTAAIAARALVDVGAVYDALASALMAWTPPPYSPFTAAQLAKLNQSGRNQLTALAAGVAANFAASIEQRRIAQAAAMRGNAYIAYLGALELTAMMPTIDSGLRSTALRRLEALLGDADRALATTSRADPTSDSLSCRLDLNAVIRDP